MSFEFTEIRTDDEILTDVFNTLRSLVLTIMGYYKISGHEQLSQSYFRNEDNYRAFFNEFARFANDFWSIETNFPWDFSSVPYKESSEQIDGLIKILRTGGAHSECYSIAETNEIEENFRTYLQSDSSQLLIFSIGEYRLSEDEDNKSFSVGSRDVVNVSAWFFDLAWDDLMFIINPDTREMIVIAITDED